jgi:hypothetical protein
MPSKGESGWILNPRQPGLPNRADARHDRTMPERPQKITFADMRDMGIRGLLREERPQGNIFAAVASGLILSFAANAAMANCAGPDDRSSGPDCFTTQVIKQRATTAGSGEAPASPPPSPPTQASELLGSCNNLKRGTLTQCISGVQITQVQNTTDSAGTPTTMYRMWMPNVCDRTITVTVYTDSDAKSTDVLVPTGGGPPPDGFECNSGINHCRKITGYVENCWK